MDTDNLRSLIVSFSNSLNREDANPSLVESQHPMFICNSVSFEALLLVFTVFSL